MQKEQDGENKGNVIMPCCNSNECSLIWNTVRYWSPAQMENGNAELGVFQRRVTRRTEDTGKFVFKKKKKRVKRLK